MREAERSAQELERIRGKLTDARSRAEAAEASLREADGVVSLAPPHGLLPGDTTTVALGSGIQRFRVQKVVFKADGTSSIENEAGQSVPMGTWR